MLPKHYFFKCFRDITAGATATAVAPKFSDTLTLFQPEGSDSAPTSQRLHQNSDEEKLGNEKSVDKKSDKR